MEKIIDMSLLYERYKSGYNKGFKDGIKGSIPKDQYEARLKADLKAILVGLQMEIEELDPLCNECDYAIDDCTSKAKVNNIIQQKINSLKEQIDETKDNNSEK